MKAEKKQKPSKNGSSANNSAIKEDMETTAAATEAAAIARRANELDPDLDITFKDNIQRNVSSWTLTGREAEALHMEEEDEEVGSDDAGVGGENSDDQDTTDPLQKLLQSG